MDESKLEGELSSCTNNYIDNSTISRHLGVITSISPKDKCILRNLINEIKKYEKFYKIKFVESLSYTNEE